MTPTTVPTFTGHIAPGFEPVGDLFESYLAADPGFSAQLCVYHRDQPVVDIAGGPHLGLRDVTGVYSVTKGVAALTLAALVNEQALHLDDPVHAYWPEFAAEGKTDITVGQLLSHQAGLPILEGGLTPDNVAHSADSAARLARQRPLWHPGHLFGYHALTIGILMEELVRRCTGQELRTVFDERIRSPRSIDFYLGSPPDINARYRNVLPPHEEAGSDAPTGTLAEAALGRFGPRGGHPLIDFSPNNPTIREAGPTATGGVGSAHGLAALYTAALGHLGPAFASTRTLALMIQERSFGRDRVLEDEMSFGAVFQRPTARMPFGSYSAFGHDGAGGALAFADPYYGIGFGYIPAPAPAPGSSDHKAVHLSRAVRHCITESFPS